MIHNAPFLLLFIGGVVLTVGDIVMKKWVANDSVLLFFVGLSLYLVSMVLLAFSFRFKNIAVASTLLVVFNVIVLSAVSWIYFKEALTPMQMIGIFLGMASVLFLEFS